MGKSGGLGWDSRGGGGEWERILGGTKGEGRRGGREGMIKKKKKVEGFGEVDTWAEVEVCREVDGGMGGGQIRVEEGVGGG